MKPAETRFRRLAFLQVLLGILAFAIAEGQPILLIGVGLLCVIAWFITEGPRASGLPRPMLNVGALLAVGLVLLEYKATRGARPVVLVGHLTLGLQVLILFGQRGRREYAQLAVLSPLQMISASVLPGGVTLIYGLLLLVYCGVLLMTAIAAQVKRAGDLVSDHHKRGAEGMEGAHDGPRPPAAGSYYRLQLGMATMGIGLVCACVAGAVFVTTPRSERSEFAASLTRPSGQREAGFSNTVELLGGSISDGSPEPVLNLSVSIDGLRTGSDDMPWLIRGSALDFYDPHRRIWFRSLRQSHNDVSLREADRGITLLNSQQGTTMQSEITLRRLAEQTIFTPAPVDGPIAMARVQTPALPYINFGTEDQQLLASSPMKSVHTYTLSTWLSDAPDPRPAYEALARDNAQTRGQRGQQLPRGHGGRSGRPNNSFIAQSDRDPHLTWAVQRDAIQRYAARLLEQHGLPTNLKDSDPATRLAAGRALADELRSHYRYTTDNPPATEHDPVADFLFNQRSGHCELFASGLCAMCRTVGIPARIVTGFRASEYNEIGEYYIVRQQHAHAWTEIDLGPGGGWHTLDATPAADVNRQHQTSTGWLASVRSIYDHVEFKWIATMITFDQRSQEELLGGIGALVAEGPDRWAESAIDWVDLQANDVELDTLGYVSLGLLGVALVIAVFSLVRLLILRHRRMVALQLTALPRAKRRGLARQLRFYIAMLETLERHGHVRPRWQSPYGFARELAEHDPMSFDPVVALTELFYEVRFGYRHLDPPRKDRVKVHLRRLEQALAAPPRQ